jgi:hypothetical protein
MAHAAAVVIIGSFEFACYGLGVFNAIVAETHFWNGCGWCSCRSLVVFALFGKAQPLSRTVCDLTPLSGFQALFLTSFTSTSQDASDDLDTTVTTCQLASMKRCSE